MLSFPSITLLITMLMSVMSLCHCQEERSDQQSPWFITLYATCPSVGVIRTCRGSLIKDNWIITTATCVQCRDANTIPMVVADIGSANDDSFHSQATGLGRYIVDKVVIHSKFSRSKNNIVLLHLQHPVVSVSKHAMLQVSQCYQVNKAMLANPIELLSHYAAKTNKLSGSSTSSDVLLGDKMKVMKRRKCNQMSATCKASAIGSTEFCATFTQSKNASCDYDEGMTLAVHSGDDWIMAGFVHEEPKDCRSCPIWFTDVCKYYEWVKNIISSSSMTQGKT